MQSNKYAALVLVNGKPIKEYSHKEKTFVEGRPGTEYSLKIKNNSGKRVLAIVSIDGIDVISGEPADFDSQGYIIDSYDSIRINGFRQSIDTVGTFKFCKQSQSYCNEAGAPGNNGVIGIHIIEEKDNDWFKLTRSFCAPKSSNSSNDAYYTNNTLYSASNIAGSLDNTVETTSFSVGTTWGESKEDKVQSVKFDRSNKTHTFELYYASKKDLKKMGISFEKKLQASFPQAFGKFAKPPKNWKK